MSKYRCPVCGATHKQQPDKCRLCGQVMTEGTIINETTTPREAPMAERGIGGIAFALIGLVLLIAVAFILLGLTPANKTIDSLKNKLPVVGQQTGDGWEQLRADDGPFTVDLPGGERVKETFDYLPALNNGKLNMWTAKIGSDTKIQVAYGKVDVNEADTAKKKLDILGDQYVKDIGNNVKVDKRTDTGFAGLPALSLELRGLKLDGKDAYQRAWLILRGDTIYIVSVTSIYRDTPPLERVLNSLDLNPPPAEG